MDIHDKNIKLSIDKNIIGTCNLVKCCNDSNIKLIYLSTNYVYPGLKGNYKEYKAFKRRLKDFYKAFKRPFKVLSKVFKGRSKVFQ